MTHKTCSNCKEIKSVEIFHKDKKSSDGVSSWCNVCHCTATKKWRRANKDKITTYGKIYARTLNGRFKASKREAARRNLEWTLTYEDFEDLASNECFYCNGILGSCKNSGSGLDRVDNDKGYEYDNLRPCCVICNKIKNNFLTMEETLVAVQAIIKCRQGA